MSRLFDVVVFGATGFTGKFVVKYFHQKNKTNLKWAIVGRSHSKLSELMTEIMAMKIEGAVLPSLVVADATDYTGLVETFRTARVVLNCTGPYRFLGYDIVRACIEANANYMDICGEPQFMEKCFLDFHDIAEEKGVLILHACAFDSVPADLGCLYTARLFPPNRCSQIESFLVLKCPDGLAGHYTTFECAVHGIGDSKTLKDIRKSIVDKYKPPSLRHTGPTLKRNSSFYFDNRMQMYAMPFMGADASVVRSSMRSVTLRRNKLHNESHSTAQPPSTESDLCWPQYAAYMTVDNWYNMTTTAVYGSIFQSLASFSLGRSLLLSCPELATAGIFSHDGPNDKQLNNTAFDMHFFAKGYSSDENNDDNNNNDTNDINDVNENVEGTHNGEVQEVFAAEHAEGETPLEDTESRAHEKTSQGASTSSPSRSRRERISSSQLSGTSVGSKTCNVFLFGAKPEESQPDESNLPDKAVHVVVSGPEPGYVATPMIFVTLAKTLLEERDSMPRGGVLTPASAYYNSETVFERLEKAGISFKVLEMTSEN